MSRMLSESVTTSEKPDPTPTPTVPPSDFVGELDIPRLHVSAAVRAGDDEEVLTAAVGYLPDTPPP